MPSNDFQTSFIEAPFCLPYILKYYLCYKMSKILSVAIHAVLWIRIRSDPKLLAGSGSGIYHYGSGSGQPGSEKNFK
jgi:hypothetical protein